MATSKQGDVIELDVVRDRKPLTLRATLVDDPSPKPDFDAFWRSDWFRDFMRSFDELQPPHKAPTKT
jgi:hypothetical protein